MPQGIRRRKHVDVEFSANNKISKDLSRGMIMRELSLHLTGAATTTAVNNTAANTQRGDEWGVVKRIEIIANGTNTLRSFSGTQLRMLNYLVYGASPKASVTLGDGATANPAFASTLIVPFWSPKSVSPIDTALDTRNLSSLKIEVTWGTYTDINSASTAWTTEPNLRVDATESFGLAGPFAQAIQFQIEKEITATNAQFQIQLPVGPLYRGFLINTTDAGADDTAVLNNFKWKSGTTVYADIDAGVMQDVYNLRNGINRGFSGTAYDDFAIGDDNDFDGWYLYDHVTDGYQTEALDTLGFSEHELELDVTVGAGTTKIVVIPLQVIPIRKAA